MRLTKSACYLALVLILLVGAGCAPLGGARSTPASARPTATLPLNMTPAPAPTPTIGPFPRKCPISSPASRVVFAALHAVIGTTPVWGTWALGPNRFHLVLPPPYPSNYFPPYGWQASK